MIKKLIDKIKSKASHFYYMGLLRNSSAYARYLGVRLGDNCQFIDDPKKIFGSEPWLIGLGEHVRITYGVRILTHEGGGMDCSRLR